jgi:hypothetical protein
LFGDLELDRPAGLPLDHRGAVLDTPPDAYVAHPQPHEVAAPQLAINGEIEEREVASTLFKLEADADRPNLLRLERAFLAGEAAFVPGSFGKANERWDAACMVCLLDPTAPPQRGSSIDPRRIIYRSPLCPKKADL